MTDKPEAVDAAAADITRAWLEAFEVLDAMFVGRCPGRKAWAPVWAPGPTYMLQCDFCYMIGPDMFERFVMPDLVACCEAIAYPFYHLDGPGQLPHVDHLLSIEKLRGIQWVPGAGAPPASDWLELLDRIRSAGKLVQVFATADEALHICREIGGRGMILQVREPLTARDADAFVAEVGRT
jgi:5-methyltetrahydrofolate--homocysteine methyltransferase